MQLHRSAFSALFALSFFFAGCGEEEPDPSKKADLDETSEGEETEEGLGGEATEEETEKEATEEETEKEATECAAGSWDDDSDSTTACVTKTACVAGEYVSVEGDAKTDRNCTACEEGSFSPEENAATCTVFSTCRNGVATEGSEVADVVCQPEIEQLVTAGDRHSCALLDTGAVYCWGRNSLGQLGDDSEDDSRTPVAVDGMDGTTSRAVSVSIGYYHSCAVLDTGAVNCWGRNEYGQLGDGSNSDSNTPVSVSGIDGTTEKAASVSGGERHSCAVLETGAVNCWGYNDYGQLGDGSNSDSNTPVAVSGIDGTTNKAVSVSTGNFHTCALLDTGAVNCWGRNTEGQLGNDSTTESTIPVPVDGMDGITKKAASISIGYSHSCAVLETGAVNCWGYNGYGQLGDGSEDDSTTPVAVSVIDGTTNKAVSVSTGVYHSCAVLDTGAVNCWGWNPYGQLGNDSTTSSSTPGAVNGIDGSTNKAVSISIGTSHSCAVLDTGAVNCWGLNGDGQLGDDSITSRYTPVTVVWP